MLAGDNNIYISNVGALEAQTIRIGTSQLICYIQGIANTTLTGGSAVFVDATTGQLGIHTSSHRYKDNIQELDSEKAYNLVSGLKPVTFNYKNDKSQAEQLGLIAEDVEKVNSKLVIYNKENDVESVKYESIPMLLLAALKYQDYTTKAQLKKLVEEIKQLKATLN